MFECSLYGLLRKKFEWPGEKFNRVERVYSKGIRKAFLYIESARPPTETEHPCSSSVVVFKEAPDKNKQRTSVVSKISKVHVSENIETFLNALGYEHSTSNTVEGFRYLRNGYQVEITRLRKAEDQAGSIQEGGFSTQNDMPPEFLKFYVVKVFVETQNVNEGEMLLENAFQELSGQVNLVKPNLSVFSG